MNTFVIIKSGKYLVNMEIYILTVANFSSVIAKINISKFCVVRLEVKFVVFLEFLNISI